MRHPHFSHLTASALAAFSALAAACSDPANQAAKQRIFSPEEPPKAVLSAAEPIDPDKLAGDAKLAHRVLIMGPAEAFERMGPHRQTTSLSFAWKYGKAHVKLGEERAVTMAGAESFAVSTSNDGDQGLDLVHAEGRTFARSKYQPFRERKRDRGRALELLGETYGGLRSVVGILNDRVGLLPDGAESISGRSARRYLFTLLDAPLVAEEAVASKLPEVQFPGGGPDPDTKRRLDFANLKQPRSVEGKLWVDAETGVPLKAELSATATAPGDEPDSQAVLSLSLKMRVEDVGEKLEAAIPTEYLPDEDRPNGVAAALKRFEITRPDAGVAGPESEEPRDSDD